VQGEPWRAAADAADAEQLALGEDEDRCGDGADPTADTMGECR